MREEEESERSLTGPSRNIFNKCPDEHACNNDGVVNQKKHF